MSPPFHLAFPVLDLDAVRQFYIDVLGAVEGRSTSTWVDFDFHGHQLSAHRVDAMPDYVAHGDVDNTRVPLPHFGVVLDWADWEALAERVRQAGCSFVLEPRVRFRDQPAEQGTFFVRDPSGNVLEFKALRNPGKLFD